MASRATEERWLRWWPVLTVAVILAVKGVIEWRDLDALKRQIAVLVDVTCDAHPGSCKRLVAASLGTPPAAPSPATVARE